MQPVPANHKPRPRRKRFYLPTLVIFGVALIMAGIQFGTLMKYTDRRQSLAFDILRGEAETIVRALEAFADEEALLPGVFEVRAAPLLASIGKASSVAYVAIIVPSGRVTAHSDPKLAGAPSQTGYPLYKALIEGETLTTPVKEWKGEKVYEILQRLDFRTYVQKYAKPPAPDDRRAVLVGLRLREIEAAEAEDWTTSVLLTLGLLIIGTASLYFLIVLQNYYVVNRALDGMETFADDLVQGMASALVALDEKGAIVTINREAERLFQVQEKDIRGQEVGVLFPEGRNLEVSREIREKVRVVDQEFTFQLGDGREIPVALSVAEIAGSVEGASGRLAVIRDLSEIQTLKNQIQRSERLASLGRMAAAVAHEVRNPLNTIKGFAQFLKEHASDAAEAERTSGIIIKEVERLEQVVNELIDYSKPLTSHPQRVQLNQVIRDSLEFIAADAKLQNVFIDQSLDPDMPEGILDEGKLKQALLNIYLNALDAMEEGGTLSVRTEFDGGKGAASICIEDTGAGIKPENLAHIFDPFFTTKKEGSGLGLAIVHKIVENLNGHIKAASEPNRGTQFRITFPLLQEKTQA